MLDFNSTSSLDITPVFCDWLTAEVKETNRASYIHSLFERNPPQPERRSAYGRTHGYREETFGIRLYRTPNSDLDTIMVFDGACLGRVRAYFGEGSCCKIAAILSRHSKNISRIDLTLDIMDKGAFSYEISSDSLNGILDTGRRKQLVFRNVPTGTGCTLYIGSRASPLYIRLYDKQSESKGRIASSRIEIEAKGELAKAISSQLSVPLGHLKASQIFTGLIRKCFDTSKYSQLEKITYGDVHLVDIPEREEMMDKKDWLTRQVMPSFDNSRSDDAIELWEWFQQEVTKRNSS